MGSAKPRRSSLPPGSRRAIQHDDLHGGNILVGLAGDRFFDWGDAVVAHPFGTLTTTFNSIADKTGLDLGDPALRAAARRLSRGMDRRPAAADLIEVSTSARDLACIGKALAWERAFIGLRPTRWTTTATRSPAG